jgi:cytochrome c biogenesis protein CcdA
MSGEVLNPLLAFGAGALTIMSPCVLPLVPVVLGSAAQSHRRGPLALALGLVGSFTLIGFFVAAFGSRLGVDAQQVRASGAIILAAAGAYLLLPRLQDRLAVAATPLISRAAKWQHAIDGRGLAGQAAIGALLGVVWSPCIGPTLGAAVALAAQGQHLSEVALTMAAFGAGIATVLLLIAFLGREVFNRIRTDMSSKGKMGKFVLGGILLAVGVAILSGFDRQAEAFLVDHSPSWLIDLTTML